MVRKFIYISLCILSSVNIFGQNAVTLKECLELGLQSNYSLRIVRNEEQMATNDATWANAGMLPKIDVTAGYSGTIDNTDSKARGGETTSERNVNDNTLRAGIDLQWTIFDGFKMQADYARLRELRLMSQTQTRIAIEDFIANFTAEYYNYVQQLLRLQNFQYAVKLSRERMRIVQERYIIGENSRLDLLQARVDFNADSAESVKQSELLATSRIRLHELMAKREIDNSFCVADSSIHVDRTLSFDELWSATLQHNTTLIEASQNKRLAEIDLRSIRSRDYPYLRLNAGYGYTQNIYDGGAIDNRKEWGADFGLTLGFRLFDGTRSNERKNAKLSLLNAELQQQDIELSLYADLSNLWQAFENNKRLLSLERQNVVAARENYEIAYERYMLGDLSGIEMREAQKSLLDAEERILVARYNTKLCEISLLQLSGNISKYLE